MRLPDGYRSVRRWRLATVEITVLYAHGIRQIRLLEGRSRLKFADERRSINYPYLVALRVVKQRMQLPL